LGLFPRACARGPIEAAISVESEVLAEVREAAVNRIPVQVIHKHTGLLAHSIVGCAYQIRYLLKHPEIAARLSEHGHEHVREELLITGNLKRYLTLSAFGAGNGVASTMPAAFCELRLQPLPFCWHKIDL